MCQNTNNESLLMSYFTENISSFLFYSMATFKILYFEWILKTNFNLRANKANSWFSVEQVMKSLFKIITKFFDKLRQRTWCRNRETSFWFESPFKETQSIQFIWNKFENAVIIKLFSSNITLLWSWSPKIVIIERLQLDNRQDSI